MKLAFEENVEKMRRHVLKFNNITDEIAPGVVRMAVSNGNGTKTTYITLKPGSYEWGNIWKKDNDNKAKA